MSETRGVWNGTLGSRAMPRFRRKSARWFALAASVAAMMIISVSPALAQTNRLDGEVILNGQPTPEGTRIVATAEDQPCGAAVVGLVGTFSMALLEECTPGSRVTVALDATGDVLGLVVIKDGITVSTFERDIDLLSYQRVLNDANARLETSVLEEAAEEVATAGEDIVDAADDVAAATQDVAAVAADVATATDQVADIAEEAAQASDKTAAATEKVAEAVQELQAVAPGANPLLEEWSLFGLLVIFGLSSALVLAFVTWTNSQVAQDEQQRGTTRSVIEVTVLSLVILAVVTLGMADKITSEGIVSVIAAVAGYAIGRASAARPEAS